MNKIKKLYSVCYALLCLCASCLAPRVDSPQEEFICRIEDLSKLNERFNTGNVLQVLFSIVPGGIKFKTKELPAPYMYISSSWKLYTAASVTFEGLNRMLISISKSIEEIKTPGQICFVGHKSASEELSLQLYKHANEDYDYQSMAFTWIGTLAEDHFRYVVHRLVLDRLPSGARKFSEESNVLLTCDGSTSYVVEVTSSSPKEYRPSTGATKAMFANIKNLRLEPRYEGVPSFFVSDAFEVIHVQKNRRGKKAWLKFLQDLCSNFEANRKWFKATDCLYIDSNGVVSPATGMPYKTETFDKSQEELLIKALQERTPVQVWVDDKVHIRFADPTPESEVAAPQEVPQPQHAVQEPQPEAPQPQPAAAAEIPAETAKIVIPREAFDSGLVVRRDITRNIDVMRTMRTPKDTMRSRGGQLWYMKSEQGQARENAELTEMMYRLQKGENFKYEGERGEIAIKEIIDNLNRHKEELGISEIILPAELEKYTKHLVLVVHNGQLFVRIKRSAKDFTLKGGQPVIKDTEA